MDDQTQADNDQTAQSGMRHAADQHTDRPVSRRTLLRNAVGVAGTFALAPLLAACSTSSTPGAAASTAPQASTVPASSAAPQAGTGVTDDEIILGMSAAFKGPSKGLGIELYRGAMAYLEQINQAGGVNGRRVVIKAYDDQYQPIPTIDNTIRLVEADNVFLLWNYVGTPTVTRILPLLKRYSDRQVYLFFPFTGAQTQREAPYNAFVFNLRASYRQETAGLVENLARVGRKRVAICYQADAYGRSGWDGVRRALAAQGSTLVAEATYSRGTEFTASMQPQIDILRQGNPDAVILIGAYAACAALIRDARDAGWDVPIANVSFVGSESLLKLLADAGKTNGKAYTQGLITSQVVPSYQDTALEAVGEYRDLMDRYKPMPPEGLSEEGYQPVPYSFVSFEGFLNAKLLVEMLKKMGDTPQRERIGEVVEGIKNLDLGINAPVSFGPQRHQGLDAVYYTTVKDAQWTSITDWKEWA